jgi:hypothetical protein
MHKSWKLKINNEDFICLEWNERGWLTWDSACLRRTKTTGCGETSGRKQVRGDSAKRASTQNKLEGGGKRASTQKYLLLLLPVLLYRGKRRPRSISFFCFQSCLFVYGLTGFGVGSVSEKENSGGGVNWRDTKLFLGV